MAAMGFGFRFKRIVVVVCVVIGAVAASMPLAVALGSKGGPAAAAAPATTRVAKVRSRAGRRAVVDPDPEQGTVAPAAPATVPEPQVEEVVLGDEPAEVGDTGITVDNPEATSVSGGPEVPESVSVAVLDASAAEATGASAFAFRVDRSDGVAEEGEVGLTIDYSSFADAFGGDYGSRLVVKEFPECVLERPEDPACATGTVLEATNDDVADTLTLDVPTSADPEAVDPADPADPVVPSTTVPAESSSTTTTSDPSGTSSTTDSTVPESSTSTSTSAPGLRRPAGAARVATSGGTVLALTAGVSGTTGSFAATSLQASQRWQAGGSSGGMSWSYPLTLPAPSVGAAPALSLDYSSQAVDGMTASANSQPGEVGLGWSLGGVGFIERRYRTCSQDGGGLVNGDLCWHSSNATISLNGVSSNLVPTPTSGSWRLEDDPNWRVEHRFDGVNGDDNHEFWVVTTPDGTQYWFGYGREPGSNASTNSAWTVPVFGNDADDPCHAASFDDSFCDQAWRWNLDRIVDVHGNMTSVFWSPETNYYGRQGYPARVSQYTRGGIIARIEYSKGDVGQNAPAKVVFNTSDRCTDSFGTSPTACPPMTTANASHYPDVPVDLICTNSGYCPGNYAPSFFSTKRLTSIVTSTWAVTEGTSQNVDRYDLIQTMPAPPAGTTGEVKLWLDQIKRTGYAQGSSLVMPTVDLDGVWLANRADANPSLGVEPANMPRVRLIREELGGETSFTYGQPTYGCSNMSGDWDQNHQYCFPVWVKPDGQPGGWSVANKWMVTQAKAHDITGGSPDQVTNYTYQDAPAWHHSDDPVLPTSAQTWSDYRGHSKVKATTGSSTSTWLYYRGMDGDKNSDGTTKTVAITTVNNLTSTDSNWLAGRVREDRQTDTSGGGLRAMVHGYDVDDTTLTDSLGHRARRVVEARLAGRIDNGSGPTIETYQSTVFDGRGFPIEVHDEGDQATTADDRCSQIIYADNQASWIRDRVARVKTDNNCAAPYDRITDTFYDNHAGLTDPPLAGRPTKIVRYEASTLDDTPMAANGFETTMVYDAYGRVTQTTSAAGKVTTTAFTPANAGLTRSVTVTADPGGVSPTSITRPPRCSTSAAGSPNRSPTRAAT